MNSSRIMTAIKCLIKAAFTCPAFILFILGGISFAALSAALISQFFFGLYPCELCIYQRIPYAVVVLLAIFGYAAAKMMSPKFGIFNIALCGIAFLINSGIAFYHVGVEQHWWVSGCSMPDFQGLSVDEIREKLEGLKGERLKVKANMGRSRIVAGKGRNGAGSEKSGNAI